MANLLTALTPKLLAQGLMALRGMAVMPRLVNSDYSAQAAEQGDTINIPIPSAIAAQAVTPGATPPLDLGHRADLGDDRPRQLV